MNQQEFDFYNESDLMDNYDYYSYETGKLEICV